MPLPDVMMDTDIIGIPFDVSQITAAGAGDSTSINLQPLDHGTTRCRTDIPRGTVLRCGPRHLDSAVAPNDVFRIVNIAARNTRILYKRVFDDDIGSEICARTLNSKCVPRFIVAVNLDASENRPVVANVDQLGKPFIRVRPAHDCLMAVLGPDRNGAPLAAIANRM